MKVCMYFMLPLKLNSSSETKTDHEGTFNYTTLYIERVFFRDMTFRRRIAAKSTVKWRSC